MRVLVVDDDDAYLKMVERALSSRGHDVVVSATAFGVVNSVAGRAAEGGPPDVVVLDHRLPGLNGGSLLALLAADRRTRDVPVLLVSNEEPDVLRAAAAAHARCQWLQKGRLSTLIERVETLGKVEARPPG